MSNYRAIVTYHYQTICAFSRAPAFFMYKLKSRRQRIAIHVDVGVSISFIKLQTDRFLSPEFEILLFMSLCITKSYK